MLFVGVEAGEPTIGLAVNLRLGELVPVERAGAFFAGDDDLRCGHRFEDLEVHRDHRPGVACFRAGLVPDQLDKGRVPIRIDRVDGEHRPLAFVAVVGACVIRRRLLEDERRLAARIVVICREQ